MSAKWHYAIKTWQTKIWKPVFALSKLLLLDTHSTQVIRRYRLIFCSHLELNQFSSFPEVVIKKRPCISCNICCKLFQRMFSDPVKRKWVRWSNFNINIMNNFLNKYISLNIKIFVQLLILEFLWKISRKRVSFIIWGGLFVKTCVIKLREGFKKNIKKVKGIFHLRNG